jgi:hypothetical protein
MSDPAETIGRALEKFWREPWHRVNANKSSHCPPFAAGTG